MSLRGLSEDVDFLKKRYRQDVAGKSEGRLVIRCAIFVHLFLYLANLPSSCQPSIASPTSRRRSSEKASKTYTTEVVTNILTEEGKDLFDARYVSLGHTLQGGVPSPRDRTRAIRLTVKCIDFLERHHKRKLDQLEPEWKDPDVATIVIEGAGIRFVGLSEMVAASDFKHRRGKAQWWAPMKDLIDVMAGRRDLEEVRFASRFTIAEAEN